MLSETFNDHVDDLLARCRIYTSTHSYHDHLHEATKHELDLFSFTTTWVLDGLAELLKDHHEHLL